MRFNALAYHALICAAHVSASSVCIPRDLADVTLGTLASPIRSDGQDMREDLCLDPTNNTSDFVVFRLNRFAESIRDCAITIRGMKN